MEGRDEDLVIGATRYSERFHLGTGLQLREKDYKEPSSAPFFDASEIASWSFWRACIAEFFATFLFLYVAIATILGNINQGPCKGVGAQGVAWAFSGMIFALVYCTAGISGSLLPWRWRWISSARQGSNRFRFDCSDCLPCRHPRLKLLLFLLVLQGGHINPAVTFAMFLARKVSFPRALMYIIFQCLGAICGAGVVKAYHRQSFEAANGGSNFVMHGYTKADGFGAETIGTFVLVYTVFSATDAKRQARESHVPVLAPLPIGFAVFVVHLATIPVTGTGINPARSLGAAVMANQQRVWEDHWVFWVAPLLGASLATTYHQFVIRALPFTKNK